MSFRFEKLEVWQEARKFAGKIYKTTKTFPREERFGLIDQLRRAAVSIALNIAEGSDRKSDVEFIRFLRIAISSAEEVVTALYISLDQKYIKKPEFDDLYEDASRLVAKTNALVKFLKSGSQKTKVGSQKRIVGSRKTIVDKHSSKGVK